MDKAQAQWRLGLDIGSSSLGWAAIALDRDGTPQALIDLGSRIFPAGVDETKGKTLEAGKEESRNTERRNKRMLRRQLARRAQRLRKLFTTLRSFGLLPSGGLATSQVIHDTLTALDERLRIQFVPVGDHRKAQLLPYLIRAAALDVAIEPHALGRALFHLCQRRGFKSNRKEVATKESEKEVGPVKEGIQSLTEEMLKHGARTLGEYLSMQDPDALRIRKRWTSRAMYEAEFDLICDAQKLHHPTLSQTSPALGHNRDRRGQLEKEKHRTVETRVRWQVIRDAIFHQRPLKSQKGKVGRCEFIPEDRRVPVWLPEYQRFRVLQAVNHLRVRTAVDSSIAVTRESRSGFTDRRLTDAERRVAIDLLTSQGAVKFTSLRTSLNLRGTTFSLEVGGEKQLKGDTTNAKMREVFKERWDSMSSADRTRAINDVQSFVKDSALLTRAHRAWGLDDEGAKAMAAVRLEAAYAPIGRTALSAMLPHLETGLSVQEARQAAFPKSASAGTVVDSLQSVRKSLYHLRNPTVERCLTEVRRVTNELIRAYGKPNGVYIELARDIKRSKKDRVDMTKRSRDRESERERAAVRLHEHGINDPSRLDIDKVLLHEECRGKCPYTGFPIALSELVGKASQWNVEHIIPFSRCMDDSFVNKTLCWSEENGHKGNRTPFEAYSGSADRYAEILKRVEQFEGSLAAKKLTRFRMENIGEELLDEFTSRQLNDTRYASRLAAQYVGALYGGTVDEFGVQRVYCTSGQATAHVRRLLGIEGLLHPSDSVIKNRDDHRHHAVDAVAIALTGPAMVKALADCADQGARTGHRRFGSLHAPWPTFGDDLKRKLQEIVVSHRGNRRLAGPLHEDTNLSSPIVGDEASRHIRKPVGALTSSEIGKIVDPVIRAVVQKAFVAAGNESKRFSDAAFAPFLTTKEGRKIPINKVRITKSCKPVAVGRGGETRHVLPGSNHHMAIVAVLGKDGKPTEWEGHIVTRLEANRRHRAREQVIQTDWGDGRRFCFTLASGDMVRIEHDGRDVIALVRGVSGERLELQLANDARESGVVRKKGSGAKVGLRPQVNQAMKRGLTRLEVSPAGVVRTCNA